MGPCFVQVSWLREPRAQGRFPLQGPGKSEVNAVPSVAGPGGSSQRTAVHSDAAGYVDAADTDGQFLMLRGRRALAIVCTSLRV